MAYNIEYQDMSVVLNDLLIQRNNEVRHGR